VERVLIVAKTHMNDGACVGGLLMNTNRHIRLLTPDRTRQPEQTPFDVGQLWGIDFRLTSVDRPNVESVVVTAEKFLGQQPHMRETLLRRVQPWQGFPWRLFDGLLTTEEGSCYIARSGRLPKCSVGYWLPDAPLTLIYQHNRPYYQFEYARSASRDWHTGVLCIRYVGFAEPLPRIPADTLLRVSLARWWKPDWANDERCYLQLSGWYT
jgi:hypothetical protein